MGQDSKIQWCDHTFNGVIGCTKISPGCANCYAAVDTYTRVQRGKGRELWGPNADRHVTSDANWKKPLAWNKAARASGIRARVFSASLSDVFEDRPDLVGPRDRLFGLIAATNRLDWLVLTKRPETAARYFRRKNHWGAAEAYRDLVYGPDSETSLGDGLADWPPRNVWLGVSVEDRKYGLPRIDILREIPASIRFLSCEPLLEDLGTIDLRGIDWVIVGGESGPHARLFNLAWARSIQRQCAAAGVAFFCKQLGAKPTGYWLDPDGPGDGICHAPTGDYWKLRDGHGGDIDEFPHDLRVRQMPTAAHKHSPRNPPP